MRSAPGVPLGIALSRLLALAAALLVVVGLSLATTSPARAAPPAPAAAAAPAGAALAGWAPNGCTSPFGSSPSGVSFKAACDRHDGCYHFHASSQAGCDEQFYTDMKKACGPLNLWCQSWAFAYYRAVRTYGWPFYACRCDPKPPFFAP